MSVTKHQSPEGTNLGKNDRIMATVEGHDTHLYPSDILSGTYNKLETEAGSGISGIAESWSASVTRTGNIIKTEILIDLTGLNSSAAADIIGDDAAANCHIGQITTNRNGTLVAGRMSCLETPATGEPDIDLYSATEATGTEDTAITGLTETALLNAGADWTGVLAPKALTALPADGEYLYIVGSGAGTDATYTAGKLLIELWGEATAS